MQGAKTDAGVLFEADGQEPINASLDDNDNPRYQTDDFRMLYMKVLPCCKRFVHDWSDCPFSHPGEKARRRDPKTHNYTGIACPDMKKTGMCIRSDNCPYAHNVFEYWLHPTRYRSQLCNDGPKCRRRVCFFAHTIDQLRVPPSKPFVTPENLTDGTSEVGQMQVALNVPIPGAGSMQAHADLPPIRSPVANSEPPMRNMSMSTVSTSGSVELPVRQPTDVDAAQSSSTFAGAQNVSFAPPEGYKEAEQQGRTRSNPDEPSLSRTGGSMGEAALQEVAANLDSVKVAIKTGAADRGQIIDMLTNLLRETLQEMPGACTLDAAMKLAAASSSNSASSTLPASSQPQRPPDPFTAAADRSFDAPWPVEEVFTDASGQAASEAGLTAALSAALSGAQMSMESQGLSPMPSGEALLGSQPGIIPRQSSAPEALLSGRAAASGSHLSRPTTTDGAALPQPQLSRGIEAARPPIGRAVIASSSQQQQQQTAAQLQHQQQQQQQHLVQQLNMRRAALLSQYRNRSMHQLAASSSDNNAGSMTSALEEYSRTGDLRALQRLSAVMGPPVGALRSLSAEQGFARPAAAAQQLPGGYEGQLQVSQQQMDMAAIAGSSFDSSSGALTARDLLYPDSFANAFAQVAGSGGGMANLNNAAFLQAMEFNAPRTGSAPAYLDTSQNADAYSQAYSAYLSQDPQMFGSAYSDRSNT